MCEVGCPTGLLREDVVSGSVRALEQGVGWWEGAGLWESASPESDSIYLNRAVLLDPRLH
eukprot:9486181-Prorocentrum_lima.AAC.1